MLVVMCCIGNLSLSMSSHVVTKGHCWRFRRAWRWDVMREHCDCSDTRMLQCLRATFCWVQTGGFETMRTLWWKCTQLEIKWEWWYLLLREMEATGVFVCYTWRWLSNLSVMCTSVRHKDHRNTVSIVLRLCASGLVIDTVLIIKYRSRKTTSWSRCVS